MRHEKLDPALQLALNSGGTSHLLFLNTEGDLDGDARQMLQKLKARSVGPATGLYTANLSLDDIDQLSEKDWVKYLRLSQTLRPL